jgi:antitoxin component YwqK of YwqJK toxin-antitoxin module
MRLKPLPLILLLISCGNLCFGQGSRFQFYLTKACSTVEKLDTSYYLMPLNRLDTGYAPQKGTVYLPAKGKYMILVTTGPLLDSPFIEIKDTSLFIFRYKEPKIQQYISGAFDSPPIYVRCDSAINGYAEDFYPDGKIKMRGSFRKGYQKDSLVTFYPNGKMKRRITSSSKLTNLEEYDTAGNLIKLRQGQRGSFMTYLEYRSTEFYPNGKFKIKESSIKRVTRIDEFYLNGQLKLRQTRKNRTEYYENGVTKTTYTWRGKKDHIDRKRRDFIIYKNEYDNLGQILRFVIFEDQGSYQPQPDLDISKSNMVKIVKEYKNGKVVSTEEDMHPKEYLKKNGLEQAN